MPLFRSPRATALLAAACCVLLARPAAGQAVGAPSLAGRVVDAEAGEPLAGALVTVQAESPEAVPGGRSPFLGGTRSTTTDAAGGYRFDDLSPGRYLLRAERLGYRAATLTVELRGTGTSHAGIGLSHVPIQLQPIGVAAPAEGVLERRRPLPGADDPDGRLAAERLRRERYLSGDAQVLTHETVAEAVTLGESDLFRAMRRMPGVGTRDDLSAELWTRGGRWDQTRVYFDGVPVFEPLHAYGTLSGINVDAVGGAFLHPGVRPASLAEGAAGVVDVRSRPGGGGGALRGTGELSLLSVRAALDQRVAGGRAAWMVSGRRSYIDWITAEAPDSALPYAFSDLTARADVRLGRGALVEASGTWARNAVEGDVLDLLTGVSQGWGSRVERITLDQPLRGGRLRHTLGRSRSAYRAAGAGDDPPERSGISHAALAGEWRTPAEARVQWTLGYQPAEQVTHGAGPRAGAFPATGRLRQLALWAERRWSPAPRLTVAPGLRVEAGGGVELSPRLAARYGVGPDLAVSLGAGRSVQYAQAVPADDGARAQRPRARHLWLLPREGVPPVRSDVATAGAEWWPATGALASVNAFARRSRGVALAAPVPGSLGLPGPLVVGETRAYGAEAGARRLLGRWTVQGSYAFAVAETRAAGARFPAAEDRRHTLDATTMLRASRGVRVGAAFTAASGAPYTPFVRRDGADTVSWIGPPGSRRGPAYASLDLLVEGSRSFGRVHAALYLQLHNALGRDNDVTYLRTVEVARGGERAREDRFTGGVPRLPNFGVRAAF